MKNYRYKHGLSNIITRDNMPVILRHTVGNYNHVTTVEGEKYI